MSETTCLKCRMAVRSTTCVSCGPPCQPPSFDEPNPALELYRARYPEDIDNTEYPFTPYRYGLSITDFTLRQHVINDYAFAVPNDQALAYIAMRGPVVEIGAGLGYWAHLLARRFGCEVHAYDIAPVGERHNNYWKDTAQSWFKVEQGGVEKIGLHQDKSLLLCWPPYDTVMAASALMAYQGENLFYVGEGSGGCTGDQRFHDMLESCWDLQQTIRIPQWWGIRDYLFHYVRRARNT